MKSLFSPAVCRLLRPLPSLVGLCGILAGCQEDILTERPQDFLNSDVVLVDRRGFESAITALHDAARSELAPSDVINRQFHMQIGTDIATTGFAGNPDFVDYRTTLTPTQTSVDHYWDWAYLRMLPRANVIIEYAERPAARWASEAEKNAIVAEARFFRAYTYNVLANLYGGVPIVDRVYNEPKLDFVRATRQQVLAFAERDLVYAAQWLPLTTPLDGRIVRAAAQHLLSEVYLSLEQFDKSIESASAVINSGQYQLMTNRFGRFTNQPGDVFSDLFRDGNLNRASGNREMIWNIQFEFQTPGGVSAEGQANRWVRAWSPRYWDLRDPDNRLGMQVVDSLGRGVSWVRPTTFFLHDLWRTSGPNDLRNSPFNIRRTWFYNNPASRFFRQRVLPRANIDTMVTLFPMIRKIEGEYLAGATVGMTFKEYPIMRLAETYLLRAEAHLKNGDRQRAAEDINVVRNRARATPITAQDVTLDFILDERARELIVEEPRRRTLVRTGTLVDRVRRFNMRASTRNSIQDIHRWYPIPQRAIDANIGATLEQNPGY